VLPDIPPLADCLSGYDVSGWFGIGAPKNTPSEIVERLNMNINSGLADLKIKGRLVDLGATSVCRLTRRLRAIHRRRNREVGQVIRVGNIKPT